MVWLLGNKLDYEGAKKLQQQRSPLIELSALFAEDHHKWVLYDCVQCGSPHVLCFHYFRKSIGDTLNCVRNMPRPRFSRSHLPWHLLPSSFETVKPRVCLIFVYTS